ncbi:hypothetical protein KUTeg_011173 [Tegillarca granosa]|uniref:Cyanophycinase n=1 Tax=Tegillarca granosa TaxID=220873 RepID=A0ABQ9F6Q0_TEGGR|nr:hypothetical protein KUTeg_011173 [Tegillarca granosa]
MGIINAASTEPLDGYKYYHDLFLKYGVLSATRIPIDVNRTSAAHDQNVVRLIKQQTGFFFGGGDQYRVVQTFLSSNGVPSPALVAIKEMFAKGAVVAGTSAGTTCQTGRIMVRSGMSWEALRYGAHDGYNPSHSNYLVYHPYGGIGMLDKFVLDSHFSQRGREGRMIALLAETVDKPLGSPFGIGIDENTALVITHAGTDIINGKIIGEHGVTFFDLSSAHYDKAQNYFSIRNVYLHYLTHGDNIGLQKLNITFSASKRPMNGHEVYTHSLNSSDIFDGDRHSHGRKPEFVRVATSVFDATLDRTTYGETYEKNPAFKVFLSATGREAGGWVERKSDFHTDITSYKNLYVEIHAKGN